MEISRIQPNCSELVVRIMEDVERNDIIRRIESIGLIEVLVKDAYTWFIEPGNWDDETNEKTIKVSDLPQNVKKLVLKYRDCTDGEKETKYYEKLKKLGYDMRTIAVNIIPKNGQPDRVHGASVHLYKDLESKGYTFSGHQHCQPQIFPIMRAVSEEFGSDVEPYDGGSINEYDAWVEDGCPDPYEWIKTRG